MKYRPSQLNCNNKIIFVCDKICANWTMREKPNYESKKIRSLRENGINFKLKHRKAHNSFFLGDLLTGTGDREMSYPGELVCMSVRQVIGDRLYWLLILRFLLFATLYTFSHQSGTCYSTSFPGFSPTLPRKELWERGCRPETLSICLQILVQYLLDYAKHCSELCAIAYTSATGIYNKGESLVLSHLTRKIKIENTLGIIFLV